ncbi:MAG: hypothetical protein NDF54_12110, partial [archaeon GB-1867-035]|nr:hypothetical protein [Candidatus Culexmicrobium profundum]
DLRGIQSFIRECESIKGLIAGSIVIDYLTLYALPRAIQELLDLPPECILYSGGGIVTALIPNPKGEKPVNYCKWLQDQVNKSLSGIMGENLKLNVAIGGSYFSTNYVEVYEETMKILLEMKNTIKPTASLTVLGFERLCDVCRNRPASVKLNENFLCPICSAKINLGLNFGLKSRWEKVCYPFTGENAKTMNEVLGGWMDYYDKIMETLAGHGKFKPKKTLNLSLLEIDGNCMGVFMSNTLSFTDAFERSIIIDISLKKAFRKLCEIVFNATKTVINEFQSKYQDNSELKNILSSLNLEHYANALRTLIGFLYVGGDDALIILPSWLAIPASIILCEEFYRELGRKASLSIGIASSHAKENIWALLESASILMEIAKKEFRSRAIMAFKDSTFKGSLSFIFFERGLLSGNSTLSLISTVKENNLSLQPYEISSKYPNGIEYLISSLFKIDPSNEGNINKYYEELIKSFYKVHLAALLNLSEYPELNKVKYFRELIHESIELIRNLNSLGKSEMVKLVLAHLFRSQSRLERINPDKADACVRIVRLLLGDSTEILSETSLFDIYQIIKFMGGGAV